MIPNLSVLDNLFLCHEDPFRASASSPRAGWRRTREPARGGGPGRSSTRTTQMGDLSAAQKQMVEIARLLWLSEHYGVENPILILDEPTTVLQESEVQILFSILNELKKRASIVFITHRLEEVVQHSDRDLRAQGRRARGHPGADVTPGARRRGSPGGPDDGRARALGRALPRVAAARVGAAGGAARARGLQKAKSFRDFSLDLHAGEIVGLVGLLGSGKEEVCRCLLRRRPARRRHHRVRAAGRSASPPRRTPSRSASAAYPSTAGATAWPPAWTWPTTSTCWCCGGCSGGPFLVPRRERESADRWVKECLIKTPSLRALCGNLSGGNQQKVVIAKWLAAQVQVLILDHPTRGIDVGAKEEIYARIRDPGRLRHEPHHHVRHPGGGHRPVQPPGGDEGRGDRAGHPLRRPRQAQPPSTS